MSHASDPGPEVDEFEVIARLLRPLTGGAPEALGLLDDAAILPARRGFDLVVSNDMIVEGVHFLPGTPLDLVARKLLRVNLSDLAAKGAEPYGYFLAVSWPQGCGWAEREAFARGLAEDQAEFGLILLGGDTTSTSGPLTASATILGWTPHGRAVLRSGAQAGDLVLASGAIGDGWLGLLAESGRSGPDPSAQHRYRLPEPRLQAREALRAWASACADISDGLVADAGKIALASGVGIELDLDHTPLSASGHAYLAQADCAESWVALATGGDDYELVCTAPPQAVDPLVTALRSVGLNLQPIGRVVEGQGVVALLKGQTIQIARPGYQHV